MDRPKFRNYPCSSWLLVYGNTIEKPGNCNVQPTGLQKRVWGRGSSVNSCVVQLLVHTWHVWQQDWAAGTGDHSSKSLCLKPMETTVAGSKLYAQPYSSGSTGRPQDHFSSLPGKKPHPPILLGYMVLWLLAPRRIKHSAWNSRTKSCPWTWLRFNKMPSRKGKAAAH